MPINVRHDPSLIPWGLMTLEAAQEEGRRKRIEEELRNRQAESALMSEEVQRNLAVQDANRADAYAYSQLANAELGRRRLEQQAYDDSLRRELEFRQLQEESGYRNAQVQRDYDKMLQEADLKANEWKRGDYWEEAKLNMRDAEMQSRENIAYDRAQNQRSSNELKYGGKYVPWDDPQHPNHQKFQEYLKRRQQIEAEGSLYPDELEAALDNLYSEYEPYAADEMVKPQAPSPQEILEQSIAYDQQGQPYIVIQGADGTPQIREVQQSQSKTDSSGDKTFEQALSQARKELTTKDDMGAMQFPDSQTVVARAKQIMQEKELLKQSSQPQPEQQPQQPSMEDMVISQGSASVQQAITLLLNDARNAKAIGDKARVQQITAQIRELQAKAAGNGVTY